MNLERRSAIHRQVAGYGLSLLLTGAAFAVVHWQRLPTTDTLGIVFVLGLAQIIVHFRCFLQVGLEKSARDQLLLVLFSAVIITLMVSGTLVLLLNLRGRMMPDG